MYQQMLFTLKKYLTQIYEDDIRKNVTQSTAVKSMPQSDTEDTVHGKIESLVVGIMDKCNEIAGEDRINW